MTSAAPNGQGLRLRKVEVRNFRCIHHVEFETDGYTLLIGRNNAGKTSVVDAIRCFFGDLKFDGDSHTRRGTSEDVVVTLELAPEDPAVTDAGRVRLTRNFTKSEIWHQLGDEEPSRLAAKKLADFGRVVHVPAVTRLADQTKTGGPSPLRELVADVVAAQRSEENRERLEALSKDLEDALRGDGLADAESKLKKKLFGWRGDPRFRVESPPIDKFVLSGVALRFEVDGQDRDVEEFGSGFQRQLIASLLQVRAELAAEGSEGMGVPMLLLFEEPEIFQHPAKQRQLARTLRELADNAGWCVIASTHSPHFVERGTERLSTLVRVARRRSEAGSTAHQAVGIEPVLKACRAEVEGVLGYDTPGSPEEALELDMLRYELDLDIERAAMFFADLVLLVEGATEFAVFHRLVDCGKLEVPSQSVEVVQTYGKYGMPRFLRILDAFGIPVIVVHDRDAEHGKPHERQKQEKLNGLSAEHCGQCPLAADPLVLEDELESELGWPEASKEHKHQKPLVALRHLERVLSGDAEDESLETLCARIRAAAEQILPKVDGTVGS